MVVVSYNEVAGTAKTVETMAESVGGRALRG